MLSAAGPSRRRKVGVAVALALGLSALVCALVARPPPPTPPCPPLHAHCRSSAPRNVSDTDLTTDSTHCGACGIACAEGASCKEGRCVAPVRAIAVGRRHVCAADAAGAVRCWGDGSDLQLGDGSRAPSSIPVLVPGLDDVVSLAAAESGTCALRRSGAVACWGTHEAWPRPQGRPRAVVGLPPARQIMLGAHHACAVTRENEVWCWGEELEPGDVRRSFKPVRIPGVPAVIEPAADGGSPVTAMADLADARIIAAGATTSCAGRADGSVACWGDGRYGQLGPAVGGVFPEAVRVTGLPRVTAIAAAWHETCAVTAEHALHCWGGPELRVHPEAARPRVEPVGDVEGVVMAYPDVCAVRIDGTVTCRHALGGRDHEASWKQVAGLRDVASLSIVVGASDSTGYALRRSGGVVAFSLRGGRRPAAVEGLRGVRGLGVGERAGEHACALTEDRGALCWSHAEVEERLTAGDATLRPRLLAVRALDGARQLGDGLGISAAGRLVGWGPRLRDGALATFDAGFSGHEGGGSAGAARFAQSQGTLCVLFTAGEVACRGEVSADPVRGLSRVAGLAVGDGHACALREDGEVWCWGDNTWGAVGQDRPAGSATPVTIPWGPAPPRAVPAPDPADEAPPFLRRRPGCDSEGVDACVYLGCAGMACLDALLAETDPVRVRYMRRLSDAAARIAQEGLARGEDPGGVAHAELAMFCAGSGPCGHKNEAGVAMDDGYACLTAAESALGNGDLAGSRAAQARACRCDPRRAQIPVMGGVLACDGRDRPVQRGKGLSLSEAQEIRACAECSPDAGPAACGKEVARLRGADPDQARYVEEVRVPLCREE